MAAIKIKSIPIWVTFSSSSIIPPINSKNPKNPRTGGIICENIIKVPVAILSHFLYFSIKLIDNYFIKLF